MISKVVPVVKDTGEKPEWFETWFDSPYYHLLYQHRDEAEAERFMEKLILHFRIQPGSRILDVACGKGRHSLYLNKKGFDVTGFDLSCKNIEHDKVFENETLSFYLHDMREVFRVNYFDYVFNLFSSFGYFDKDHDNLRCITSGAAALKRSGIFVLDYFNSAKVIDGLPAEFEKDIEGIVFHIRKFIRGNSVCKEIRFNDNDSPYLFEEKVGLFMLEDFQRYFRAAGMEIIETFGDYKLNPFDKTKSDRLIIVGKKG